MAASISSKYTIEQCGIFWRDFTKTSIKQVRHTLKQVRHTRIEAPAINVGKFFASKKNSVLQCEAKKESACTTSFTLVPKYRPQNTPWFCHCWKTDPFRQQYVQVVLLDQQHLLCEGGRTLKKYNST